MNVAVTQFDFIVRMSLIPVSYGNIIACIAVCAVSSSNRSLTKKIVYLFREKAAWFIILHSAINQSIRI